MNLPTRHMRPSRVRQLVQRRIHFLEDKIAERTGTELPYRLYENEKDALLIVLDVYLRSLPPNAESEN